MNTFDKKYQEIIENILENGYRDINKRTGVETAALPGVSFSIDLEKDGFPLLTLRKIPVKMWIAEQIWFIAGERKPENFLRKFTKIWDLFTEEDGNVAAAYGYRWRKHFGRDQLGELIELLEKDPSSRHGVVVTWDPAQDGLLGKKKKNVPCPYTFTVNIIDGRLHLHNIIRSNDMILGLPADVAGFSLLLMVLAQRLGVKPGVYTHSISNAHIYKNHYEGAKEIINRKVTHEPIHFELVNNFFERAEQKDELLVDEMFKIIKKQYKPQDKIDGLTITL
jgi:thymidylate synthase